MTCIKIVLLIIITIIIMSSFHTVISGSFLKVQWQQASLELQDFPYDPGCVQQRGGLHGFNLCSDSNLV